MKTLILSVAIAFMMSLNVAASNEGANDTSATRVKIFQTTQQSVDVYVAKNAGDLVKIKIYSESGTSLMSTRIKKEKTKLIRYHLNELPEGSYTISVEKNNQVLSSLKVSK